MEQLVEKSEFNVLDVQVTKELSLEEKILLVNHPLIKQKLQEQLLQEQARKAISDVLTYQKIVQENAELEAKKLGMHSSFQVFLHPDDDGDKCIKLREGIIVHIHIYCTAEYITSHEFWARLRSILKKVPTLIRSSALVIREQYWEQRLALSPKWKKIQIGDEQVEFNLLKPSEMLFDNEIKIVRRHKDSGIVVIVTGHESERDSLEREAWVLLSQKVAIYKHINSKVNE